MVSVRNVEAYLMYEVVVLVEVLIDRVLGRMKNPYQLEQQWDQVKRAFHLFMLDLEADDFKQMYLFKDLKLPSERKTKRAKPSNKKSKAKRPKVGKQLQLFFGKIVAVSSLIIIEMKKGSTEFSFRFNKKTGDWIRV